jgi:hypothetical protein
MRYREGATMTLKFSDIADALTLNRRNNLFIQSRVQSQPPQRLVAVSDHPSAFPQRFSVVNTGLDIASLGRRAVPARSLCIILVHSTIAKTFSKPTLPIGASLLCRRPKPPYCFCAVLFDALPSLNASFPAQSVPFVSLLGCQKEQARLLCIIFRRSLVIRARLFQKRSMMPRKYSAFA